jgi:hypothetical protein
MSLIETVATTQVAAIGQLNDDTWQFAPRASLSRSINFAGW